MKKLSISKKVPAVQKITVLIEKRGICPKCYGSGTDSIGNTCGRCNGSGSV